MKVEYWGEAPRGGSEGAWGMTEGSRGDLPSQVLSAADKQLYSMGSTQHASQNASGVV